jgi:hypothetical protein
MTEQYVDVTPLPPSETNDKQVDILLAMHSAQKAESLQHRQNFFNAFAAWAAILLATLGAIVTLDAQINDQWMIGVVVTVLTALVIWLMWRQRRFAARGLNVAKRIEARLGLYEDGRYLPPGKELFPDTFRRCESEQWFTGSDWLQVSVLIALMALIWFY